MNLRHICLVTLLVAIAGCSSDNSEQTTSSVPMPEPTEAVESEAAAEIATAEQEALSTVTESAAIDEEIEAAEEAIVIASTESEEAADDVAGQWRFEEGRHFKRLTTAQGTSSSPDKIEVAEVFWYGCPHCYNFEPIIGNYEEQIPADVAFVRIPVIWNPTNQIHARAFYTAEALGKLDELHPAIFREIHIGNNALANEGALQEFFARYGVSEEEFLSAFRSFAVEGKLRQAANYTQRYQVRSVPILVVNGKYTTEAPEVASLDQKIQIANELVERERERQRQ